LSQHFNIHDKVDTTESASLLQPFWKPMHANAFPVQQVGTFVQIEDLSQLNELNQELRDLSTWDKRALMTSFLSVCLWLYTVINKKTNSFGFELWENELLFLKKNW
jgi:hypothetical protein